MIKLKCNYTENPIGIDDASPRLSWQILSDVRGVMQTAFTVGVSSTAEKAETGDFDVWTSGRQESDANAVTVDAELTEKTRYFWRVGLEYNKGGREISEVGRFETGMFGADSWQAKWIEFKRPESSYRPESYTIDFDFRIINENMGFIFAAEDEADFLMWQLNTTDKKFGGAMSFRPHRWASGAATVLDEKALDKTVIHESAYFEKHHMCIAVNGSEITTSLDGSVIDVSETEAAGFGRIGFRQNRFGSGGEVAAYSNIVIKDAGGSILFSEDFSSAVNNSFSAGTVENGELIVSNALTLQKEEESSAPMYRKDFRVEKQISYARAYVSALGIYTLEINGKRVGEDYFNPGWTAYELNQDDNNYVMYQTFDITDYLKKGDNVIGAVTGHGWYSGKLFIGGNNRYGKGSKLLCQAEIVYTDGSRDTIATDSSWLTYGCGPIVSDDFQGGEHYDAQLEVENWSLPGCDTSGWREAKESCYNGKIIAQIGPTVRQVGEFKPVSVTGYDDGTYMVDLGQNIAGFVHLSVKGNAGDTVRLRFGEMLLSDGNLYTENLRSAVATDYYTLKGDPAGEVFKPRFTFHGFRYVEVKGYPGRLTADDITGIAVSSLQEQTGSFETSDEDVNRLQSNIKWGQLDNFISVPTDCPQRDERLGYTGDGQVFVRTACYNRNVKEFFNKFMLDVITNQRSDGSIADWTPNFVTAGDGASGSFGNSGWGDAVVIIPWTMYTAYGDERVITNNYDAMKKWVARYERMGGDGYIVDTCAYGDWLSIDAPTPKNVISTGYFAYCADLLSKMAGIIGNTDDERYYRQLFGNIKAAFNAAFVGEDGSVLGNTQTSYLIALKFDLLPTDELKRKAAELLVEDIKNKNWHLSTGFLGVAYLCPVLTEMGYGEVAYRLLHQDTFPSWLYSVRNGATTIWERWNSYNGETGRFEDAGMNSFNHYSLGSVGEWFYQYCAGIQYDEKNPAYKHTVIKPLIGGGLEYIDCSYDTPYGKIISNWKLENEKLLLEVSVPANTTATVFVPSDGADGITESGRPVEQAVEIEFAGYRDGYAIFELGSGFYSFCSPYSKAE